MLLIKQITKKGIQSLVDKKILRPYYDGYMNVEGNHVGYYRTCGGKRYIEDDYADMVKNKTKAKNKTKG